jgi:AP endonuclease 1
MKNQRKWENPPLNEEHAKLFIDGCNKHGIDAGKCCLPHGSYLVNLAHPEKARKEQAYQSFHDDLTRCHKLGIKLYNFHPGNANGSTREEGIKLIAEHINEAHKDPKTGQVMPVLETMATLGNTIGGTFRDLADIIAHVDNKDRIGVCLDTAHVFAAGYDIRDDYDNVIDEFDAVVGLKYLKALHMNDSKAPKASYRDLHANIGTGWLGLKAFHNIVNDPRMHGLPMVLETPIERTDNEGKKKDDQGVWAREIKMLENLVGADLNSEEWKTRIAELQAEGASERERIQLQHEKKLEKEGNKKSKGASRGKSKKKADKEEAEDDEDSDE